MDVNSTGLVVIGAGPGGYAAAFLAADLGLSVTLIDREANPGGVCLYRGCIPSKALLHVAKLLRETEDAKAWGIDFGAPKIDREKLRDWKESVVKKLTGGLGQLTKQRKITYIQGSAEFLDATSLKVIRDNGDEERLGFEHAIIATGSRPASIPQLDVDSPLVMDSTAALDLRDIPESLLVVGGGYIGLEMGSVYASLGSRVTVVEMMPTLLPGVDKDMVNILARRLGRDFEAIHLDTTVVKMEATKKDVAVVLESEGKQTEQRFDKALVSVGRKPNTGGIGLDKTGVKLDGRGFIEVDSQMRTAEPAIFAIGDVVGEPMLAHKASHEGRVAAEVVAGGKAVFEPRAIPAVVFTDPEMAWCGLTESEAREQGRKVKVARFPWAASGRAMTLDRTDGVSKLILDPESERVLGVGIVGPGASELIAEGVLAVEMAAVASDLALSIHPHPTLSETIMESAEVFYGTATHLYRPKPGKPR